MKKYTNTILIILFSICTICIIIQAPSIGKARLKDKEYRTEQSKNYKNEQIKKWIIDNKDQMIILYDEFHKQQQKRDSTTVAK